MTKEMQEKLLKALDEIKDSYDAFFIGNKYDDDNTKNTHKEQFALLSKELELPLNRGALAWIKYEYDCYYKGEYENESGTAFGYIRNIILNGGIRLDTLGKEELISKVETEAKNGVFVPNGYATCCVSCKHFKVLHDSQGAYYGCAKHNERLAVMPPMCNSKERE